jgi:hypothetical protein
MENIHLGNHLSNIYSIIKAFILNYIRSDLYPKKGYPQKKLTISNAIFPYKNSYTNINIKIQDIWALI